MENKNGNGKLELVSWKLNFPDVVIIKKDNKEYIGKGPSIQEAVVDAVKNATGIEGKIIVDQSNFRESTIKVKFGKKDITGNFKTSQDKEPSYLKIQAYLNAYEQFAEQN